jgi:hypothetical protein
MNTKDKLICVSYALISLIALPATWINNLAFITQPYHWSFMDFVRAVYANSAASSLSNDMI